jgi:dTDP-4-dehydrorhamnose 3,5-epimerase
VNIFDPSSYNTLRVTKTDIQGLLVIAIPVHGDNRGWFKESYQKEKMVAQGFPDDFEVVQNNVSYNAQRGATRGIHAEPWDKYISISVGSAFAAIVDLRKGDTFGKVLTFELNPGIALFVPKGCGNSYQSLEDGTTYSYLVNAHWSPDAKYTSVNLADPDLNIKWPLPLEMAEVSAKDKINPMLKEIQPMEF